MARILGIVVLLGLLAFGALYALGRGVGVTMHDAGTPTDATIPAAVVAAEAARQEGDARALGIPEPKQILFGDLHVHSTFSLDAFQMSLPMAGGDGAYPISDACDYARFCSGLDFWSINDHALSSTPVRWSQTIDAIRQCNAVTNDPASPDSVAYLGWEWTQIGTTPDNHFGHKNVIFRDLEEVPPRPIAAGPPPGDAGLVESVQPSSVVMGLLAAAAWNTGGREIARLVADLTDVPPCATDVPEGELPTDCREQASTPGELFGKLERLGLESMVIPHGTTWGMYTPPGSAWDKQLTPAMHDAERQPLVEVFSGHGNSEEYRSFEEVAIAEDGSRSCPEPVKGFLPACWHAGTLIEGRCAAEGGSADDCAARAATTRQNFVDADRNGGLWTVPATTPADWLDAGQCNDCFQPSFNYRPKSSVQYMMALGRPGQPDGTDRFRFGFIAASDNHSSRPGTGYKEVARTEFTEQRFGYFPESPLGTKPAEQPDAVSREFDSNTTLAPFAYWETERAASFFLNGGLAAVHSSGRDRGAIWDALERKEVYGTSGPRILLWFDWVNAPGGALPMGAGAASSETPIFRVRALGSREQQPGCPDFAGESLGVDRLARLCRGECHHPGETRRPITRIEVVRIRPQLHANEPIDALIEDPWRVLPCPAGQDACELHFTDESFSAGDRDTLYYVRAIEAPSQAVAADPLGCTRDATGRCTGVDPCWGKPDTDECLSETEERAWSSPIFVDHAGG